MWGDGLQTRSFCYIDDAVEGILRLMESDHKEPLNIGSEEMVTMNEMADMAMGFGNRKLPINHIPGPEGVRGRNSNNDMIREVIQYFSSQHTSHVCRAHHHALQVLKWEPATKLVDGLRKTYDWIETQIAKDKAANVSFDYAKSGSVSGNTHTELGSTLSK